MEDKTKILVVEDDATLCEMLRLNLELDGYEVDSASCAEDALRLDLAQYRLILLDVMMGEISGFEMARQLKRDPRLAAIPIIFCTARDSEDDMVEGLDLGADDYIYKPYTMRAVLARVKSVLRRCAKPTGAPGQGIVLDMKSKRCFVDGNDARLVKKEFEVLNLLMSHPGTIFSREDILSLVWDEDVYVLDRTIDVNVTRIRKKIAPYGHRLITRLGFGYGFE